MRIAFAGTPEFAARALSAIIAADHAIPLVLTRPDRPAGRGLKPKPSPVKEVALRHGLRVAQPETLKTPAARQLILDAAPEVMIVAAYGLILPQSVLDLPPRGCINIHASLLPRWRGAAPIQRAIEAGDAETGISLMQMDAGLDTGAVLSLHPLPIEARETSASLHDKLAQLGAEAIVDLLPRLAAGTVQVEPQDASKATYAAKIAKDEAHIDWTRSATEIDRRIRAFNPFPGASTRCDGLVLKIWVARPTPGSGPAGAILQVAPEGVTIACGSGALELQEVQKAGGKRLAIAAFLAGHPLAVGQRLG